MSEGVISASRIPNESRAQIIALRAEFAERVVQKAPAAWMKLSVETRCILLMAAGVDPAGEHELSSLALRDWREFTVQERAAVSNAANNLRWELNGARDLMGL